MNAPRTPFRFPWIVALIVFAGCGGNPPEVDTAETIRNEPPKAPATPAPAPEITPEASPGVAPKK